MGVMVSDFVVFNQRSPRARQGKKNMDASVSPSDVPFALSPSAVDVAPDQQLDISAWLLRHIN